MTKKNQTQNEMEAQSLRIQWHRMKHIIKREKGKERKKNDWTYIAYKKRRADWENKKKQNSWKLKKIKMRMNK